MVSISVGKYRRRVGNDVVLRTEEDSLGSCVGGGKSILVSSFPDTVNIRIGTVSVVVVVLSLIVVVVVVVVVVVAAPTLVMGKVTTAIGPPFGQPTHLVMVVLDNIIRGFEKFVSENLLDWISNDREGKLASPYWYCCSSCCCVGGCDVDVVVPIASERSRCFVDGDIAHRTFE
jgi:hypothetical protein